MEAMDSDPDEAVRYSRTERFELRDDLHKLNFRGVDEFARFLENTVLIHVTMKHTPRFQKYGGRKTASSS
jgi:hypothetical protein